jgi:hypothetical protein
MRGPSHSTIASVLFSLTLALGCHHAAAPAPVSEAEREQVKRRLHEMVEREQAPRAGGTVSPDVDRRNTDELKAILDKYEWVRLSQFGADADRDAALLVQHAVSDPDFQVRVLAVLERMWKAGETRPSRYAYLYDRVALVRSYQRINGALVRAPAGSPTAPQRYGTQGRCVLSRWEPFPPLEDPGNVDRLRAEMGLPPLDEYRKSFRCD